MKDVKVKDIALQHAAGEGMDAFVQVFVDAIKESIGGELTAETMAELNVDQITLLGYHMLREEVMEGGFVQLIHNGLGSFIFLNPFAKVLKLWGLKELSKMIYEVRRLYAQYYEEIERDCSDEEFVALYERFPEFEDYDDDFIENEEDWTEQVARHVDENIENFAKII